jgi:hypothetical protein
VAIVGPSRPTRLCAACGTTIDAEAEICPYCGVRQPGRALGRPGSMALAEVSERRISQAVIMVLGGFLGVAGIHRFYVGKKATGFLMFFTLGGLGLWSLIDFFLLVLGKFRDKEGRILVDW